MDWTKLGNDALCLDDEIGRWTIEPYGDTTWLNLFVEVPASEGYGTPETQRRRLPATANKVAVGFFGSAGEAKIGYAILNNAPMLDLKGKDAVLSEMSYTRKPFADEASASLIWQDLSARPAARYEGAPAGFSWYQMLDGEIELAIDESGQVTTHSFWAEGNSIDTLSMMTAPELLGADGQRIALMPGIDHAAVQVNTANQILEARLQFSDDPRIPLRAGQEEELLEMIEDRVDDIGLDATMRPGR